MSRTVPMGNLVQRNSSGHTMPSEELTSSCPPTLNGFENSTVELSVVGTIPGTVGPDKLPLQDQRLPGADADTIDSLLRPTIVCDAHPFAISTLSGATLWEVGSPKGVDEEGGTEGGTPPTPKRTHQSRHSMEREPVPSFLSLPPATKKGIRKGTGNKSQEPHRRASVERIVTAALRKAQEARDNHARHPRSSTTVTADATEMRLGRPILVEEMKDLAMKQYGDGGDGEGDASLRSPPHGRQARSLRENEGGDQEQARAHHRSEQGFVKSFHASMDSFYSRGEPTSEQTFDAFVC